MEGMVETIVMVGVLIDMVEEVRLSFWLFLSFTDMKFLCVHDWLLVVEQIFSASVTVKMTVMDQRSLREILITIPGEVQTTTPDRYIFLCSLQSILLYNPYLTLIICYRRKTHDSERVVILTKRKMRIENDAHD